MQTISHGIHHAEFYEVKKGKKHFIKEAVSHSEISQGLHVLFNFSTSIIYSACFFWFFFTYMHIMHARILHVSIYIFLFFKITLSYNFEVGIKYWNSYGKEIGASIEQNPLSHSFPFNLCLLLLDSCFSTIKLWCWVIS